MNIVICNVFLYVKLNSPPPHFSQVKFKGVVSLYAQNIEKSKVVQNHKPLTSNNQDDI